MIDERERRMMEMAGGILVVYAPFKCYDHVWSSSGRWVVLRDGPDLND